MEILTRKLEDTHDEIQRVRGEVVEALKAFYGGASSLTPDEAMNIASTWTSVTQPGRSSTHNDVPGALASEMDQGVERLARSLDDITQQLQLDGASASSSTALIGSFAQRERLKRQMEQSQRMLVVVEKVTHLDNLLFDVDSCVDKGDLIGAAEALTNAQRLRGGLDEERDETTGSVLAESNSILHTLGLQLLKKKNRVLQVLNQAHATVVSAKPGLVRTKKPLSRLGSSSTILSNVEACSILWRASALLDILPSKCSDLAKLVSSNVLKPLFASDAAVVKLTQEPDGYSIAIVVPGDGASTKRPELHAVEHLCSQIVTLLRCLHAEVLGGNAEFMQRLAACLWNAPGNLESQLLGLFQDRIPAETSAVNAYRDTVTRVVQEMETALAAIGFTIPTTSQVRKFGSQINVLYAKKRRQQLLLTARSFMSREYRNSTKVTAATERCNIDASLGSGKKDGKSKGSLGGVDALGASVGAADEVESGPFRLPEYRVTHCAHDVVELAHQTMMEACTQDAIGANTFFHTSRDILFVFRSVVPTLYQGEIANDATTCMLFHNDCMYIAHHMLTIGHFYKARLPSPLSQIATMVDMVPAFREAAENALTAFAKTVSDELRVGVHAFKERGGTASETAVAELEQFLQSALYKLNQLMASWQDGLPFAVYNHVMKLIVQPFVTEFVDEMLATKRIGSNTAGKLHSLASLLLEAQSIFASVAQAEKHVPAFSKLRQFSRLMVQPLPAIQEHYLKGDIAHFSSHELSSLVRSLFRESPERKEFLSLLADAPHRG